MRMLAGTSMISAVIPDPPDPEVVRWVLKDPVHNPIPAAGSQDDMKGATVRSPAGSRSTEDGPRRR